MKFLKLFFFRKTNYQPSLGSQHYSKLVYNDYFMKYNEKIGFI
jgi:hypothetical protein